MSKTKNRGCLISILLFAMLVIALWSCMDTSEPPGESLVYAHAQLIVEDYLKAPSSAEYPSSDGYTVTKINDHEYTVAAYVDSENSFGAMIRSKFVVGISYNEDWSKYKATSVIIDAEKYL